MDMSLRKRVSSIQNTQRSLRWGFHDREDGSTVAVVCFYHRPYNRVAHYFLFTDEGMFLVDSEKILLCPIGARVVPTIIRKLKEWFPAV